MIRAMDGVVRAGVGRIAGVPAGQAVRQPAALGLRGPVVGGRSLDGVVKRLGPTPLDVLNQTFAAPTAVMSPAIPSANAAGSGIDWPYAIGFSLVVPAMIAASVISTTRLRGAVNISTPISHVATATTLEPVLATAVATPPAVPDAAALAGIVSNFISSHGSNYSVVVKDLATGETTSQGADTSMTSASLYKLFVAKTVYQMIDSGKLDYGSSAGNGQTISNCLYNMLTWSDNDCGTALGTLVGWERQNGQLKTEGFAGTTMATPQRTSAQDVAKLFERLHGGTLLSPASSKNFLDLLKAQKINNRLPAGLPGGTVIAHKTGDLYGFLHDAGIVYGPKSTYLIVVMGAPGSNANNFGALSQQVYGHFNQ